MIKLSIDDLSVSSFATAASGGDDDTGVLRTNTDPAACPYTQGWNCTTIVRETDNCDWTNAAGCGTGGGAGC